MRNKRELADAWKRCQPVFIFIKENYMKMMLLLENCVIIMKKAE